MDEILCGENEAHVIVTTFKENVANRIVFHHRLFKGQVVQDE